MKNLKVAAKLIVSFLIVAVFTAIVGGAGIVGMLQISKSNSEMYKYQTMPMPYLAKTIEDLQRMRVLMREYILGSALDDLAIIQKADAQVAEYIESASVNLALYRETLKDPEVIRIFDEAAELFVSTFQACLRELSDAARSDAEAAEVYKILDKYIADNNKIMLAFDECMSMKINDAANAEAASASLARTLLAVIIVVLIISLVAAIAFALYISSLISKPLLPFTAFMKKAGGEGDLVIGETDAAVIGNYATRKDEIGQMIGAAAAFVARLNNISNVLETISNGDLTSKLVPLSKNDTMGNSLNKMTDNLNNMFGEINTVTSQVSIGSKQVADGAQALAQGSTEQAATVEQLSASIMEISRKTRENADLAGRTSSMADQIKENAEKGSRQMDQMMDAVKEISQASQSISKVIKVIDDIAFQTNILALNAAVEAARAGQHGKGFAVVAEEVRNLAAKSSEAAKDTGGLIANAMEKAELGSRIAEETAESLTEIVSGVNESTRFITEIAESSEEQSSSISEITKGIDQVSQVIQQNSATAQESAAASEEMSGQANALADLTSQFKLKAAKAGRRGDAAGSDGSGETHS